MNICRATFLAIAAGLISAVSVPVQAQVAVTETMIIPTAPTRLVERNVCLPVTVPRYIERSVTVEPWTSRCISQPVVLESTALNRCGLPGQRQVLEHPVLIQRPLALPVGAEIEIDDDGTVEIDFDD